MHPLIFFCVRHFFNTFALLSQKNAGHMALQLFAKPRKGKLLPKDRTFLETAAWRSVQSDGLRVRYYVWERTGGTHDGPTVLLAHGWESNSARWRNLVRHLRQKGCQVVALDAPAHGDSGGKVFSAVVYSQFIQNLAEQIQIDVAIGHSAGGMALTFFANQHPNRLKKIILMGVPHSLAYILDQYADFIGYAPRVAKAMDVYIRHSFGHPLSYYSTEEMAKAIETPCLIIHDEGDKTIPLAGAERIHKNWRGSQFFKTKGLGHGLQGSSVFEVISKFVIT